MAKMSFRAPCAFRDLQEQTGCHNDAQALASRAKLQAGTWWGLRAGRSTRLLNSFSAQSRAGIAAVGCGSPAPLPGQGERQSPGSEWQGYLLCSRSQWLVDRCSARMRHGINAQQRAAVGIAAASCTGVAGRCARDVPGVLAR